jgi:exodeoxyribonuclease V alpha subunit
VEGLNRQIEAILDEAGLIRGNHRFYAGLPVLITRNDYQLNLFNGDIGILLPDPSAAGPANVDANGEKPLWAWFPGNEPATGSGIAKPRRVSPSRLPDHEPAYAMTVHKSQGSEFDRVLLVLPDRDLPVFTRELIYTGLTRARTRVDLWFDAALFQRGIARRAQRVSGLRDALAARR